MGTAHKFQGGLDVSPGFGFLCFAFVLVEASLPHGLGDGLIAMSLEELSGVFADLDLAHPHQSISKMYRRRDSSAD
jgi:hypothetical protein